MDTERQRGAIKARRIHRACDFCHSCVDYGNQCTYDRPSRKRGPKHGRHGVNTQSSSSRLSDSAANKSSVPPVIAPQAVVLDLAEIFFEVVHPIFPFLHEESFMRRIVRGEYQTDGSMFAVTMAMAALSSARVSDGAVFSSKWDLSNLTNPTSEAFFNEAERALRQRKEQPFVDLEYLQTAALLAITAIQYGKRRLMYTYLGLYHTFIDMDGAHDESNWPRDLTQQRAEQRRCLFWSMYTLDVYASVVWGRTIRHREAHAYVNYPSYPLGAASPSTYGSPALQSGVTWMDGWNFTTDLYRVLEYALDHCRRRSLRSKSRGNVATLNFRETEQPTDILRHVSGMYTGLADRFKSIPTVTDTENHRLNFQAANIVATLQLVKMVAFAAEESTVSQRCNTARELLQAFSDIPIIYLKAMGSPLLYHLAGVAIILVFAIESELTETNYQEVKPLLTSLAEMVAGLETHTSNHGSASTQIGNLVRHLDDCCRSGTLNLSSVIPSMPNRQSRAVMLQQLQEIPNASGVENDIVFDAPLQGLLEDWSWIFDSATDTWS